MKFKTSGGFVTAIVTKKNTGKSFYAAHLKKNLLTNNGRDGFHAVCYTNTAAGTRGAGYVALTTGTASPAAGDTALSGTELAASGFTRADATTKTHSGGTNSTIIEHTFTASGTVNLIHASGTFNNASSTTLYHEAAFGTDASLISGDTLKVTWTLNLG
jgi:hypothetical protein